MTQVSWTRQLALAVALCLLGGLAYWLEFKHRPAKEAKEEGQKKVFALKDAQIQSIELFDGAKTYRWECKSLSDLCKPGDNASWQVVEPLKVKADDTNVNSLVSALN